MVFSSGANGQAVSLGEAGNFAIVSSQITPTVCVYGFYEGRIGSSDYNSNQFSAGVKIDF